VGTLFLLIAVSALAPSGDVERETSAGRIRIVDAAQAAASLPKIVALDARSAKEFAAGHVPGAPARPVESGEARKVAPGNFVLDVRPERRIETRELRAAADATGASLLDARTPAEFAGETMAGQKRGGHIPGAHLVPAKSLYGADGRYVGAEELKRLAGLGPAASKGSPDRPITYCTGGVRSALLAVLLEARLGVVAANYDGSLWEWSADPSLPLVK
jgi:3-mercaptopyruvate sulfurtransferase SseA